MAVRTREAVIENNQALQILNNSVSATLDKTREDFDAKVYVRNASTLKDDNLEDVLEFSVVASSSNNEVVELSVTILNPAPLESYSVVPVNLKIEAKSGKPFSRYLVVSSQEEGTAIEPGTTPLELKAPIACDDDLRAGDGFLHSTVLTGSYAEQSWSHSLQWEEAIFRCVWKGRRLLDRCGMVQIKRSAIRVVSRTW